jgi:hypothetical protein
MIKEVFMFKHYFSALFLSVIIPFGSRAEWVTVNQNKSANTPPQVSIVADDENSITLRIDIAGFEKKEFISGNQKYQAVDLLGQAVTIEPGSPEVPYIAKILAVPDYASLSMEVIESDGLKVFENISLPPSRQSWIEGQPQSPFVENSEVYQSLTTFPGTIASVDAPSILRDFRIARVSVYPVQYIPAKKELQVVSSITVRIKYGTDGEIINPKTTPKRAIAPSFGKLYRSSIFNYQQVLDKFYGGKEEGHELMLCIMPDEFVTSFQIYADWKRQSGTDIHVTKFTDIGANNTNPDIIKNHIADAYHNWEVPPTYVLIVGDDGIFPKKIVNYPDYQFPNEDYFVEIDGNDYFPELMIGRFTNQGDYRMQVMINKYMLYEKTPYTASTDWFKKAVVCANNSYESQCETKRYAANMMLEYGGFTSVDTLMSDGNSWGAGCTVDINDILNALNNGRSYLNYRGEGWYYGWYANCYDFSTSDVTNLNNGQKFTFVTSIGCGVAMFDAPGGNCFGEEWVEMGSLTSPKGGVAFLGPTSNTHTTYNNKIDLGIYTGMFQEGLDTPGQALLRGKMYMYNVYGDEYYVEYHFKIYCMLGDPSIHIWKDVPLNVNVNYPSSISLGPNEVEFTITFTGSGQPVANAEICLAGDEIFAMGISDSQGKVYINIAPTVQGNMTMTVRGGNVYPYQGTIQINQPAQVVKPNGDPVYVETTGNMDGLMNPNDIYNMTLSLKNWGTQTAVNVQATLTASEPQYIQILTTNPVNYGNLSAGGSASGSPFQFKVKPECPVGEETSLQVHVTSSSGAWDYYFDIEVAGCGLVVKSFLVYDKGLPSANFRLEPGENVNLYFTVGNDGQDVAPGVVGILSSNDPYITIEDSTGTFGTLNINASSINVDNYFEVSAGNTCPSNYTAPCTLKLYTQGGLYPYQVLRTVNLPVSKPVSTDYSGPDAYGYYAYSSEDPYYDQSPVYNWFELDGIGQQITVPTDTSDYTTTVSLPFTFKYYGTNYTNTRISTDGWIALGAGNQTAPINTTLPHNDNVNCMVAPFWDDLYDTAVVPHCQIYYYSDVANHRFIVEWDSINHNTAGMEPKKESFQALLFDPDFYPTPTGDGKIIFQYKMITDATSNTIGIENNSQNVGLQYLYDLNYDPTAGDLVEGSSIKFTTEPPSVSNTITGIEDNPNGNGILPSEYSLGQNHPNPFKNQTEISYTLPEAGTVLLQIFDIRGDLVCTLKNGKQQTGKYSVTWEGINNNGFEVSSGIYFYRLQTEKFVSSKKMFLVK